MELFYCNGKKGICYDNEKCITCDYSDGKEGYEIDVKDVTGMTIEQKRNALELYCLSHDSCDTCKCIPDGVGRCYSGPEYVAEANYERVFGSKDDNPYWERITAIAEKQRAKGMSKYGQGLEANPADILARINHLQEELIDGLMYCEWIKEWVQENLVKDEQG